MPSTQITSYPPVGLILAGGAGTRIGGNKANVALHGEPLLHYVLASMREVLRDVAVIAKPHTVLPALEGAMVWVEPELPAHPLLGVTEALSLAGGRPVLACPLDMPFITPALLGALATVKSQGRAAVLASCAGVVQPLLGRYMPASAPLLADAIERRLPPEEAVSALDPRLVEVEHELELFEVNTPDDLLLAAGMLDGLGPAPGEP
ncbi:MAG: molybdenum cofactor guanylyltransferase [Acidobacteriota bacterium]|nr:molybdenum cofactor guanylyltransferase [Acidobacteriota bacterium]